MALEDAKSEVDTAFTRTALRGYAFENAFAGATSFLRRTYTKALTGVDLAITGVAFDQAVTHRTGTRFGPRAIREASTLQPYDPPYGWPTNPLEEMAVIEMWTRRAELLVATPFMLGVRHLHPALAALEQRFPELRTPESPTQRIGDRPVEGLEQVVHEVPMLSISNAYSQEELREFDARVRRLLGTADAIEYVVELKIDGVAATLMYERGELAYAATRGDGVRGEIITHNIRTIRDVPLRIRARGMEVPPRLEVRGEVYMEKQDFERINAGIVAAGGEGFADNPSDRVSLKQVALDPQAGHLAFKLDTGFKAAVKPVADKGGGPAGSG